LQDGNTCILLRWQPGVDEHLFMKYVIKIVESHLSGI
jgi:hypothetical protein